MTLLAMTLGALAAMLALPTAPLLVAPDASAGGLRRRGPGPVLTLALVAILATVLVAGHGRRLVLSLVVLACLAAGATLVRRSRRARVAEQRQERVVEVCEALVGELRAGQPLVASLERCLELWPGFEPVARSARLGADVPAALRRLGDEPGAEGLREVAAAWKVSATSGAGLAHALGQVAATARERQSTRHLVRGELASAQATARLVALLPLASLAMSSGIGGHPWHFLLATLPGLACLALGAASAFAGLLWIDRIATSVLRG